MRYDVGVCNNQPAVSFSLAHTTLSSPRVLLRIDTSHAVTIPGVTYGGVPMTCIGDGDHAARVVHQYEIHNPPGGTHVITGNFSAEVLYIVRLFDDTWLDLVGTPTENTP
jgi:hypothetical protein